MATPGTSTPGQRALAEAARMEAARVYGSTCREHRQRDEHVSSTASVDALVDIENRRKRGSVRLVRSTERAAS